APQPAAGVSYWLLTRVVSDRSGSTDAKGLDRSLVRRQSWARQPQPASGGRARVALGTTPLASARAPAMPDSRLSSYRPSLSDRVAPAKAAASSRTAALADSIASGVSAAPAAGPLTGT